MYIPKKDSSFIAFGNYEHCEKILEKQIFFPTLLTGLSGIGKTFFIEMLCAEHERELFRVNITFQSDEDALMGGFRLKDGNTYFDKGPVIQAMERGGVLLLDEIDLASPLLIMCLQSVLEGKGYYIKKISEWVTPHPNFQIFATANTKGLGDDTGAFIGTQTLNEAFLERFPVTLECSYPKPAIEKKILTKVLKNYNMEDVGFVETLVSFAEKVRKSYLRGDITYTISTRRLVHMIKAFVVWEDTRKAVEFCLARFDTHSKKALLDIYDLSVAQPSTKNNNRSKKPIITTKEWTKF